MPEISDKGSSRIYGVDQICFPFKERVRIESEVGIGINSDGDGSRGEGLTDETVLKDLTEGNPPTASAPGCKDEIPAPISKGRV